MNDKSVLFRSSACMLFRYCINIFFICVVFATPFFSFATDLSLTAAEAPHLEEELSPDVSSYSKNIKNRYSLYLHKRTYIIPFSYNWKTHEDIYSGLPSLTTNNAPFYKNEEAEFQMSFFIPVDRSFLSTKWDLLFAYTHKAWWQVYNPAWSKPFRETNYTPEVFFRRVNEHSKPHSIFDPVAYDVGIIHQSNGQIQLVSRSWDRLFARAFFVSESVSVTLSIWTRLPEKSNENENRDISRYMGYGEVHALKTWGTHTVEIKIPISERPGLEIHYSKDWYGNLRWFVSGNIGYGHSLIEYNKETQRVGVGITLENFMDRKTKQIPTNVKEP